MTDAEKAEMKRRRAIGTLAASLENWTRNVGIYEARAAEVAKHTAAAFAVAPRSDGGAGWEPYTVACVERDQPGYFTAMQQQFIKGHNANANEARAEIAKIHKKQATI